MSIKRQLSDELMDQVAPTIARPSYNRNEISPGIVHFGVGAFHRSHQAMIMDDLFGQGVGLDWGICGVGVIPIDKDFGEEFVRQDCLYTLVEKFSNGSKRSRIIGSIIDYKYAPDNPSDVLDLLTDPRIRLVSLTITEGGYNFDPITFEFDAENPGVIHDLEHPNDPVTVFGFIIEALERRRQSGSPSFSIMSCDNIQGNGHMASKTFLAFAELRDSKLAEWIRENTAFPNSMVDRITPVTVAQDVQDVTEDIGLIDNCPVVAEPFFQWVLEDSFTQGRPPYEYSRVQLVSDVEPYELMKLRLLNVSHQAIAYFGYLCGYRLVHEAARDPAMVALLQSYMDLEGTPTLRPVPGIDLDEYKAELIERFQNPYVKDTIVRLAAESSDRIPKWLVPVVNEQLRTHGSIEISAAIIASWARYAEGVDEQGAPINVVDQLHDELAPIAQGQRQDPLAFIKIRKLFGDLSNDPRFCEAYLYSLNSLWTKGAEVTLTEIPGLLAR